MKTILITGANGFIGSNLVSSLIKKKNLRIIAIDIVKQKLAHNLKKQFSSKNLEYFSIDICNLNKLNKIFFKFKPSIVYHLAASVGVSNYIEKPYELLNSAFFSTKNIIELSDKYKCYLIYSSTSEVYGMNNTYPWTHESNRVIGPTYVDRWSYSTSKGHCEHMLFAYKKISKTFKFNIVRFFNVYGYNQNPIFIVSKNIYLAMNKKDLLMYDSGNQKRCFTFIEDAISALEKLRNIKIHSQILNIANPKEHSIKKIINLIKKESPYNIKIKKINTKKIYGKSYQDISRRIPSIKNTKKLLNWYPKINVNEGIKKIINNYE